MDDLPVLSVEDLAAHLRQPGTPWQLIDVREPWEVATVALPGSLNLPLSQFPEWSERVQVWIDPGRPAAILCHHGIRSAQVCAWLCHQGYTQVHNVTGGIDAYARRVDASLPCY